MVKVLLVLAVLAVLLLLARRLRGSGSGSDDPAVRAQKAVLDQAVITRQGGQGMGQGGPGGGMGF